jgi:hypothetical protein
LARQECFYEFLRDHYYIIEGRLGSNQLKELELARVEYERALLRQSFSQAGFQKASREKGYFANFGVDTQPTFRALFVGEG